jgi:hypothetical protein
VRLCLKGLAFDATEDMVREHCAAAAEGGKGQQQHQQQHAGGSSSGSSVLAVEMLQPVAFVLMRSSEEAERVTKALHMIKDTSTHKHRTSRTGGGDNTETKHPLVKKGGYVQCQVANERGYASTKQRILGNSNRNNNKNTGGQQQQQQPSGDIFRRLGGPQGPTPAPAGGGEAASGGAGDGDGGSGGVAEVAPVKKKRPWEKSKSAGGDKGASQDAHSQLLESVVAHPGIEGPANSRHRQVIVLAGGGGSGDAVEAAVANKGGKGGKGAGGKGGNGDGGGNGNKRLKTEPSGGGVSDGASAPLPTAQVLSSSPEKGMGSGFRVQTFAELMEQKKRQQQQQQQQQQGQPEG